MKQNDALVYYDRIIVIIHPLIANTKELQKICKLRVNTLNELKHYI